MDFLKKISISYLNFIGKINYLLFLLVAFSLALPYSVMKPIWVLWLVCWGLEFRFIFFRKFHFQKRVIPICVLGIYYLWQALSYFWATDQILAAKNLERQISFLILPLIALFGVNKNYNEKQISQWFVIGIFLSSIWYLTISLFMDNYQNILQNKPYIPLNTDTFIQNFNLFFHKLKHRFFFATAVMIASVVLCFSFEDIKRKIGGFYAWIFIVLFFILTISVVFLSGSRASIITYLSLIFIFLCSNFIRKKRWIFLIGTIAIISFTFIIFYSYHPRMENITIEKLKNPADVEKGDELRFPIWYSAITHIDEYFLTGKGVGSSVPFLKEKFKENNYPDFLIERNFHSHNQYLEVLIELGVIGLLLFGAVMFCLVKYSKKENKKLAFYIVLIFLVNSLSDTMIRPLEGVILFSFSCLFLLISNNNQKEM